MSPEIGRTTSARQSRAARHSYPHTVNLFWRWLREFRGKLVGIWLLTVLSTTLSFVLPLGVRHAVDKDLFAPEQLGQLLSLGVVILVVTILSTAIDAARLWWVKYVNLMATHELRRLLHHKLLRLPLAKLQQLQTGGTLTRLSHDCDRTAGLVERGLITPAVALLKATITVVVLLFLSWPLALAALALLLPIAFVNMIWLQKTRRIYRSAMKDRAKINGRTAQVFAGIRTVRVFGRQDAEDRRFLSAFQRVIRKQLWARRLELIMLAGWGGVLTAATALLIVIGAYLHNQGNLSVGSALAFQICLVMLLRPFSQVIKSISFSQPGLAGLERVFEILDHEAREPINRVSEGQFAAPEVVQDIELDQVTFSFEPGHLVLSNVSLKVAAGETVALVGPNGAGKTTLTNLLARLYDPEVGHVRLNGRDIREYSLESYRRLLAVVEQHVFLFDGTVAANIAYGLPQAAREEVEQVARLARAHEFILRLPQGYDTRIGERGVGLSAGQAQRVAIARALLVNPQILILDEPTSNVDVENISLFQDSLPDFCDGRICFIVAHRLATVMNADHIVFLQDGQVVETGDHQSLMAAGGAYFQFATQQMGTAGWAEVP